MSHNEITDRIWAMPFADRMSVLTLSIIERDPEAVTAVKGLISVIVMMTARLAESERFTLAEKLRDAADALERQCDRITNQMLGGA